MENLSKDKRMSERGSQAVVIGASAGGLEALRVLLAGLPAGFPLPVVIVQHLHPHQDQFFLDCLGRGCALPVREAEEKEAVAPGSVYFAPPNYHLLIESDRTFALSIDEKVNFSRPSIDVLFETAADVFGPGLIGVILTGASSDGARGLRRIRERGGRAIVQDPKTAEFPIMPKAALDATEVDLVLGLREIVGALLKMARPSVSADSKTGK